MTSMTRKETELPPHRLWRPAPVFALVFFLFLSFIWFGSNGGWSTRYLGGGNDPITFMWLLKWWPFAIRHGLNPWWSRYIWYPSGYDLAWATSVPILALCAAPLTLSKGAVFAFNVLSVLSPGLSAWTAYLLGREITRDDLASLFGGFFFGFSAYEYGQMLGHLNLDFICLVPLILLLAVKRFGGTISRRWFITLLTILLFLEFGISMEIVASLLVLGAFVWAIFWRFGEPEDRQALWRLAFEVVASIFCLLILTIPYAVSLMRGASTVPPEINSVEFFSANLLNFILPTWPERFGYFMVKPLVDNFTGNPAEQGAYLGIPLILILILTARQYWGERRLRALILSILLLILASLGPFLHITGKSTGIPLPWLPMTDLPLIKSALPTRFTMFVSLAAGITAAFWIAKSSGIASRIGRIAFTALAALFLLPNPLAFAWSNMPKLPAALAKPALSAQLGNKPNILVLPFASEGPGMAWQLEGNLDFTQSGGYVGFVPNQAWQWAAVHDLTIGTPSSSFANSMAAFCVGQHVSEIAMAPDTPEILQQAVLALGWPVTRTDGAILVRVPPATSLDYFAVLGDYWPSGKAFNWIGKNITISTGKHDLLLTMRGLNRPTSLPPVTVSVMIVGKQRIFQVNRSTLIHLVIPAGESAAIHAEEVFVPANIIHNNDQRRLSVQIHLEPAPSPAEK
ncbi:MAG: hypothetical protein KGH70_08490 [Rhodospirillales bacterium]|nr:hypothetical protein [Rhodospirillales bacterium]